MAELTAGVTAFALTRRLAAGYDILIKDLTAKMNGNGRQYIRLAVRNSEDNDRLVDALRRELNSGTG